MKPQHRPAPASSMEAAALSAVDKIAGQVAGSIGELWGLEYELPNGRQLMTHGGTASIESARDHMAYWLSKNPEAKFDLDNIRRMTQAEVDDIVRAIRAKYPRRKTLNELTGGQWTLAMREGWRVPGSKQRPPRPAGAKITAAGWGNYGNW